MYRILQITAAVLLSASVQAQEAKGTIQTAQRVAITSPAEMPDDYNVQVFSLEAPEPDGEGEKAKLKAVKEEVSRLFPRKSSGTARKTTVAQAPVVTTSFQANISSGIPPDNDLAVSKSGTAISVINSQVQYFDAQTGQGGFQRGLKQFSSAVGLNDLIDDNRYDPKVVYDAAVDRFICIMLSDRDEKNNVVVGFSLSSDPEGKWAWYKFYGDYKSDTTWFDYPGVSITKDELFLTGNKIKHAEPWETGFSETVIYQIDKKAAYDSTANLTYKIWDGITYGGKSIRNLFPVKSGWIPDTDDQYFVSNRNFDTQNDTIFLVKVEGKIAAGGALTTTVLKSPVSYGVPPNGRQPDTSVVLATNDGRILGAYAIYDEIQFVSTSVHPGNGNAAIFHGKIHNYKTSPAITYADFYTIDTLDFGYPNISFVGNPWGLNQSIISFNYTGPNTYPGTGAIMFDGADYSGMTIVKTGDSSISILGGKDQRWGDYMGSQVDYTSLGAVWVEGIYGNASRRYGNYIARLNSPALSVKNTKTEEKVQAKVYPNPVVQNMIFEFTLSQESKVSFNVYDVSGKLVDVMSIQWCESGKNLVRFNAGKLASGTYILKATSDNGDVVITERFSKQ